MSARSRWPDWFTRPWAWIVALLGIVCLAFVVVFASRVFPGKREQDVVIATATPMGEYARFGGSFAAVMNAHQDRFTMAHRTTSGSTENVALLDTGEVEFAIVESDTPMPPSIRAVASLFPEPFHFVVTDESGIRGIEDLGGRHVAVMPNLLGPDLKHGFFDDLLTRYGLTRKDLASVAPLTLGACGTQIEDGTIDAVLLAIAVGNESVSRLLRDHPVRLVHIDAHAIETWHPYVREATIYRGAYWGSPAVPARDVQSAAVDALLLTHARVPDDIVRETTRRLLEHRNELLRETPHAITVRDPDSGRDLGIPMHPGAHAWYARGEPGFVMLYAEVIALTLSIGGVLLTGLWQLRRRIKEGQRTRAEGYNLDMYRLLERAQDVPDEKQLEALRLQVFDILKRVLKDLDQGRISGDSFQLFAVPCGLVMDALRHREMILSRQGAASG